MNTDKALQDILIDKIFTDCVLTFTDERQTLSLDCHKTILVFSSDYFNHAFATNINQKCIDITVGDAHIAREVILSLYGVQNTKENGWKHLLDTLKCRTYFLLDNDPSLLYGLTVPEHGFDLLMDVINTFDLNYNHKLIFTIKNNLPVHYNATKFSDKLQRILLKDDLLIMAGKNITVIDIWRNKIINNIDICDVDKAQYHVTSRDGKLVTSYSEKGGQIKVHDVNTGLVIREAIYNFCDICCLDRNRYIVASQRGAIDDEYTLCDIESGDSICTLHESFDSLLGISNDNQYFTTLQGNQIEIRRVDNHSLIRTLNEHSIDEIYYTKMFDDDNERLLVSVSDDRTIKIWNIDTGELIRTLDHKNIWNDRLSKISNNNRFLVSEVMRGKGIALWNIKSGKFIRLFDQLGNTYMNFADRISVSCDGYLVACLRRHYIENSCNVTVWETFCGHIVYQMCDTNRIGDIVFKVQDA